MWREREKGDEPPVHELVNRGGVVTEETGAVQEVGGVGGTQKR